MLNVERKDASFLSETSSLLLLYDVCNAIACVRRTSHAITQRANAFLRHFLFFFLLSLIAWTPKITGVLSQKCFRKRSLQDAWIFSTSIKQQSSVLCPSSRVLWYLVTTCGSLQLLFKNEKKRKEKESFSFNST